MHKKTCLYIYLVLLQIFFVCLSTAPDCSPSNIYCVDGTKFKNLQAAYDKANTDSGPDLTGFKFYIKGGTYIGETSISGTYGSLAQPFEILPYPGETVILQADSADDTTLKIFSNAVKIWNGDEDGKLIIRSRETNSGYATIYSAGVATLGPFTLENPYDYYGTMIGVPSSLEPEEGQIFNEIEFIGNYFIGIDLFAGVNTQGSFLEDGYRFIVQDCKFELSSSSVAINVISGYVLIQDNYFLKQNNGTLILYVDSGDGIVIQNNVFELMDGDYETVLTAGVIYVNAYDFTTSDLIIQNNHFYMKNELTTYLTGGAILNFKYGAYNEIRHTVFANNIIEGDFGLTFQGINFLLYGAENCINTCESRDNIIGKNLVMFYQTAGTGWTEFNNIVEANITTSKSGEKPYPFFKQQTKSLGTKYSYSPSTDARDIPRLELGFVNRGPYEGCPGNFPERYSDATCTACSDSKFSFSSKCEDCKNPLHDDSNECDTCINSNFAYPGCDTCLNPQHNITDNCQSCTNSLFSFPDCSECVIAGQDASDGCNSCSESFLSYPSCDSCDNSLQDPASNCTACKNPIYSFPDCSKVVCENERLNPETNCNSCKDTLFSAPDCLICIIPEQNAAQNCTVCTNEKLKHPDCFKECANPLHDENQECNSCSVVELVYPDCNECPNELHSNTDRCNSCKNDLFEFPECTACKDKLYSNETNCLELITPPNAIDPVVVGSIIAGSVVLGLLIFIIVAVLVLTCLCVILKKKPSNETKEDIKVDTPLKETPIDVKNIEIEEKKVQKTEEVDKKQNPTEDDKPKEKKQNEDKE